MKIKENPFSFCSYFLKFGSRSLLQGGQGFCGSFWTNSAALLALATAFQLVAPDSAEARTVSRATLKRFGYDGSYTGIIRGELSSRTLSTSPFTIVPVSKLSTEVLPQAERLNIDSPFGTGSYSIFNSISASRRRCVVRGLYYGKVFNPNFGIETVRTGTRVLEVRRNSRRGTVSAMTLRDHMRETAANGGALHARWALSGSLEKK